ncbi:hypothetical protein H6G95_37020 [Nostoc linckia FACHB-391]|uniref:Uncharacterized protein n=3 Tax=Nostoc TaxID=1177 RepID=A0ABR8FAZ7_NOSLI|nr:hypothetical protein [Nostoc linckia FACHB-391]
MTFANQTPLPTSREKSDPELSRILGYADFTVRSWGLEGKAKRNPHFVVYQLCALLDEKWINQGKVPGQRHLISEMLTG